VVEDKEKSKGSFNLDELAANFQLLNAGYTYVYILPVTLTLCMERVIITFYVEYCISQRKLAFWLAHEMMVIKINVEVHA